jgi:class 3 adenylate cyclase/tetratricopeptide (TPR) repeat protein
MPADYARIVRGSLADLEFLRHERKGLSRLPSLQAKEGSIRRAHFDKKSRKDLVPATMADLETQIQKLSAAVAGLESQRKSLGNAVVDPAIAALREQLEQLESARGDRVETDERKLVTIVFADVSGFTALSEKLDPEKVREVINACFDWLVPVVQKYDGTIDKFIGDEIMAVFGAPVAHEDDAERALRAALDMMDAIVAFNHANGTELGLHIGINTGLVVAGEIGGRDRRDYSVMGDAVNLAARLEDASSVGEIFVGPATYRQTQPLFDFEPVAPLKLKGKEAPVEVSRLLRAKAVPKPVRGIEGLRAPLIGRDGELTEIRKAIADLERGRGSMLAILGEAGLGKSRLIAETRVLLPVNVTWGEGRALSFTAGMSYWLAREIVMSLLNVKPEAAQSEVARALQKSLEGQAEIYPFLARLLELPMDAAVEDKVKFLSSEALRSGILEALGGYVRGRARQKPLVLVWEDLHWCDPSSWEVLEMLAPVSNEVPLLLLCAARLEDNRLLEGLQKNDGRCVRHIIRLSPLSRDESGSLIQQLLKIENFPAGMRELILNRAEGNPFFVEELLRSLIDAGAIVLEGNRAVATREIDAVEIPETLQGVLAARIDRLPPDNKQTLQRASVIGRIFQRRVLAYIYEQRAKHRLEASLGELQRREFIQSREQQASETAGLEEGEYIFKHAITHDVAYDSMLFARRKELHRLAAEAIEALFPGRLEELSAALGYHYDRAEAAERAIFYLGRAAERAKATFANAEAIAFYESAIGQITHVHDGQFRENGLGLNEGLGDVLTLVGRHEEARDAFGRAQVLAGNADPVSRSRLHRKLGFSHSLQRHFAETAREFDLADQELGEPGDAGADWWEEKVQIQMERMHLFYWQGMVKEMRELAERYRSVITDRGAAAQRAEFLKMIALSMLMESRFRPSQECVDLARRAVAASDEANNPAQAGHVNFVLGLIALCHGDFGDAVEQSGKALAIAEQTGDLVLQSRCLTYRAVAFRRLGDIARCATEAKRTLELATKLGMVEYIAMAKASLAWIAWRHEDHQEAEKLASEALELWHGMDDPYGFDWMALCPLIAIALYRQTSGAAIGFAQGLLAENQHPLPEKLLNPIRKACEEWQIGAQENAAAELASAMKVARDLSYL